MVISSSNYRYIGYSSMTWTVIGAILVAINVISVMMGIKYNSIGKGTLLHAFSAGVLLMSILE